MRIRPRQQILDVWRSLLNACYADGTWTWGSGDEPDSISDAEQLLCLIHPMYEIETFSIADPDETRVDVLNALRPLGNATRIPRTVAGIAVEFFERHADDSGQPRFSCAGYRGMSPDAPTATREQRDVLTVVDAYARSIKLSLAVLAFVKQREPQEAQSNGIRTLARLRDLASDRLTAAMTGLLRSFVVNSLDPDSSPGQAILNTLRQSEFTDYELVRRLHERLRRVRTTLDEGVQIAVPNHAKPDLDQLFEVGWTWGIAADATPLDFVDTPTATAHGYAGPQPSLYFTVSALDSIDDLQSRRTRSLSTMNEEQRRLAEALALRWDITQRYWSTIARFDRERWPLADLPWRTSDQEESDYFSLLVLSIVIKDFINRSYSVPDLQEVVEIVEELAQRGRITRRLSHNDLALALHRPGVPLRLVGSGDLGPELMWFATDYAPELLRLAYQAVQLADEVDLRERLISVAEATMDHLHDRQLQRVRSAGLWDDVTRLSSHVPAGQGAELSWNQTERVVEALVTTAHAYGQEPPRSTRMAEIAIRLLNEADHLYNQELLEVDSADRSVLNTHLDQIEGLIDRAREVQSRRVSTSIALAEQALRLLDQLAEARQDAIRGR